MIPKYLPVIRSLDDLEHKPDYQIILQNNTRKWFEMTVCNEILLYSYYKIVNGGVIQPIPSIPTSN